jgi:hypothetical protein
MTIPAWLRVSREIRTLLLAFVVAPLVAIVAQGQTQPIFPTMPSYPIGAAALAGTAGDFNGDGQSDFAVITLPYEPPYNVQPPPLMTLTVLLNQGPTTAPIPVATTSLTCTGASSMIAADMNNDKKLDLVFNCAPGYVAVLLGNGDGTFQTPAYYAVTGAGQLATPVDLNGDGYLDVAVLSSSGSTSSVAVLLNRGSSAPGVLSTPTTYTSPGILLTIGTGDFNGDGKQDILAGNYSQLVVFYGNGNGTLQAAQTPQLPNSYNGTQFLTGDFNHDGITDAAYISTSSGSIQNGGLQVLLGSSNGFTVGPNSPLPSTGTLVPAGSTNGGSDMDIALVGSNTTILLGNGKGGFAVGQPYAITSSIVSPAIDSNGDTDLVFVTTGVVAYYNTITSNLTLLKSNGDGTFQGPPTLLLPGNGFIAVDVNGDGLTDVLYANAENSLVAALGRGNGTFSVSSQSSSINAYDLATGDFNGDGKVDVVSVNPGGYTMIPGDGTGPIVAEDAVLYYYQGDGNGTFQPSSTGTILPFLGVENVVVGDFNGDGNADVVLSYWNNGVGYLSVDGGLPPAPGSGLFFIAGKGNGTFAAPVPFAQQSSGSGTTVLLTADLRNNGKLDLISNTTVYLGNGDGTFTQIPLNVTGNALAVGDLNGDGFPDIVIGNNVYAGNGDGTFQTTPLFTATALAGYGVTAATIGDINADGHADLMLQTSTLNAFLGDGKGDFTADPNTYYTGNIPSGPSVALARLNNQAPALPNDHALDYLVFSNGGATSLLNLNNPTPTAPAPVPSSTTLTASASSAAPNQPLTFTATVTGASATGNVSFVSGSTALGTAPVTNGVATLTISFAAAGAYSVTASYPGDSNNTASSSNAVPVTVAAVASKTTLAVSTASANPSQQLSFTATVTGFNPTGSVTFVAGSTTLGTAPVTNGTATLPFSFAAAGSYTITANYAGDAANLASSSNAVSVSVVTPDFTVSASPGAVTITAGQTATIMLSVTPVGGYGGTVKFSCGTLPSGVTCTFTPASVTPANGMAATSTLTVATTAPTSAMLRGIAGPLQGIAWASIICLAFSPRRLWRSNRQLMRSGVLLVLLMSGLMAISGCSSSSPAITNPGTPKGTQTITVSVNDVAGGPSHNATLQITVQ